MNRQNCVQYLDTVEPERLSSTGRRRTVNQHQRFDASKVRNTLTDLNPGRRR